MRIVIINGSPRENGSTHMALSIVEKELHKSGIETAWVHLGKKAVHSCIECGFCKKEKRCVFNDDLCNTIIDEIIQADGILIGSPVYFASANGGLCALLDRVFYATCTWHQMFAGKLGAAVVTRYRSGGSAALDRLHKYFLASQISIATGNDFMAFPEISNVGIDSENKGFLQTLGANMVKMLKERAGGQKDEI